MNAESSISTNVFEDDDYSCSIDFTKSIITMVNSNQSTMKIDDQTGSNSSGDVDLVEDNYQERQLCGEDAKDSTEESENCFNEKSLTAYSKLNGRDSISNGISATVPSIHTNGQCKNELNETNSSHINGSQDQSVPTEDNLKQTYNDESLTNTRNIMIDSDIVNSSIPLTNGDCTLDSTSDVCEPPKPNKTVLSEKTLVDDNIHCTPFTLLAGEKLITKEEINEGTAYYTNYRLYVAPSNKQESSLPKNYVQQQHELRIDLPHGVIDSVEIRDLCFLVIFTKYVQSFVLTFPSTESATAWHRRLNDVQNVKIEELFCFKFCENLAIQAKQRLLNPDEDAHRIVLQEFKRMKFSPKDWKICDLNREFKFCTSYPQHFVVPNEIADNELDNVANFRYSRRLPVAVWRSQRNGCVIVRSSQPVVGWLGSRSPQDERLLQHILNICNRDTQQCYAKSNGIKQLSASIECNNIVNGNCPQEHTTTRCELSHNVNDDTDSPNSSANDDIHTDDSLPANGVQYSTDEVNKVEEEANNCSKLLILDARSYTAAFANRAMGGGCECVEYYPDCDIQFMGLANIHNIRKSFTALRYICEPAQVDQANWLTMLDNSKWLHHLAALLKAAMVVVDAISIQERPVLVHCSDGWDRTPQVVALAELLLDPYYRTIDGFVVLVHREWLQFGHKFADRCRISPLNGDPNERCPVFLQWLDCVHQLVRQFPYEFEFNSYFLFKLVYHTYSCLFGTFTCNNVQERISHQVYDRTTSLWSYLQLELSSYKNYLYMNRQEVLRPSCRVKDMIFWNDVYVPTFGTNPIIPFNDLCCQQHKSNDRAMIQNTIGESNSNGVNFDNEAFIYQHKKHTNFECNFICSTSCENLSDSSEHSSAVPSTLPHTNNSELVTNNISFDPNKLLSCDFANLNLNVSTRTNDMSCDTALDNFSHMVDLAQCITKTETDTALEESTLNANSAHLPNIPNGVASSEDMLNESSKCCQNGSEHYKSNHFTLELSNIWNKLPPLAELFDFDNRISPKGKHCQQLEQTNNHYKKIIGSLYHQLSLTRKVLHETGNCTASRPNKNEVRLMANAM